MTQQTTATIEITVTADYDPNLSDKLIEMFTSLLSDVAQQAAPIVIACFHVKGDGEQHHGLIDME